MRSDFFYFLLICNNYTCSWGVLWCFSTFVYCVVINSGVLCSSQTIISEWWEHSGIILCVTVDSNHPLVKWNTGAYYSGLALCPLISRSPFSPLLCACWPLVTSFFSAYSVSSALLECMYYWNSADLSFCAWLNFRSIHVLLPTFSHSLHLLMDTFVDFISWLSCFCKHGSACISLIS